MKVNLFVEGQPLNGFLNLTPRMDKNNNSSDLKYADIENIDEHVDDAEVDEFVAADTLDFVSLQNVHNVLEHWIKKVRMGGTIVIGGVDIYEVARNLSCHNIDVNQANMLLHGSDIPRNVQFTSLGLREYLENRFGFKVLKVKSEGFNYVITARRERS